MIIMMDPPGHRDMRSLLNKVFTPRAIQAQREMVTQKIEMYLGASSTGRLRRRPGFHRALSLCT